MVDYSPEIGYEICARMAEGESLSEICRDPRMPTRKAVHSWINGNLDGLGDRYARARELRAEYFADEIISISDSVRKRGTTSEEIQAARLATDNRKWIASKLSPQSYGDKVTVGGDANNPVRVTGRIELVPVTPEPRGDED